MAKLKIVMTGATGLIGRNLLFEIIKKNCSSLDNLEIFILGRDGQGKDLKSRIVDILAEDGREYISSDEAVQSMVLARVDDFIHCIQVDLGKKDFGVSDSDFKRLISGRIDVFYHVAALTDLRLDAVTERRLREVNVRGTARILELVSRLDLDRFCYVGTAYSCGNVKGRIPPDLINMDQTSRNPYEKTKVEAELIVREFAKRSGARFLYFRPSVTCGRLIEKPLGSVNKFDVFYGWGAFFLAAKKKMIAPGGDLFSKPVVIDARICFEKDGGLNIVPADFVAKVMYCISMNPRAEGSYYIVNEQVTPHTLYLFEMLEAFRISGIKQVDAVPDHLNKIERMYYRTAGKVFTPYVMTGPMLFDTRNVREICQKEGIHCPVIDKGQFALLVNYAKQFNFGV